MAMHRIEDAAALLGVSSSALRRWEAEGRISPPSRTLGGVRIYSDEDIETIRGQMAKSPAWPAKGS